MKRVKKRELVNLIDDAFFEEEIENGIQFQVRRTDFMRDYRLRNIIDEIE